VRPLRPVRLTHRKSNKSFADEWGVRVDQTQGMKGKEGTGDPGGPDAKTGGYSSGSGLCPSRENLF